MSERTMAAILGAAVLAAEQRLTITEAEAERARRWLVAALERMRAGLVPGSAILGIDPAPDGETLVVTVDGDVRMLLGHGLRIDDVDGVPRVQARDDVAGIGTQPGDGLTDESGYEPAPPALDPPADDLHPDPREPDERAGDVHAAPPGDRDGSIVSGAVTKALGDYAEIDLDNARDDVTRIRRAVRDRNWPYAMSALVDFGEECMRLHGIAGNLIRAVDGVPDDSDVPF